MVIRVIEEIIFLQWLISDLRICQKKFFTQDTGYKLFSTTKNFHNYNPFCYFS